MFGEETLLVILNDELRANNFPGADQKTFQRRAGYEAGADSDKLEVPTDTPPFPARRRGNAMCQHLQIKPASGCRSLQDGASRINSSESLLLQRRLSPKLGWLWAGLKSEMQKPHLSCSSVPAGIPVLCS